MGESIASAVIPSLVSSIIGADAPSYQQPSMDQIMTPAQKAMQQTLIDIGNMGYKEGMKYTDEKLVNKNKDFYNNMMAKLQQGAGIGGGTVKAPATETGTSSASTGFTPNEALTDATKYMDAVKDQRGAGSMGGNPMSQEVLRNAVPGSDTQYGKAAFALSQGTITPEMIEAYRRKRQMAKDDELVNKYTSGVK